MALATTPFAALPPIGIVGFLPPNMQAEERTVSALVSTNSTGSFKPNFENEVSQKPSKHDYSSRHIYSII